MAKVLENLILLLEYGDLALQIWVTVVTGVFKASQPGGAQPREFIYFWLKEKSKENCCAPWWMEMAFAPKETVVVKSQEEKEYIPVETWNLWKPFLAGDELGVIQGRNSGFCVSLSLSALPWEQDQAKLLRGSVWVDS